MKLCRFILLAIAFLGPLSSLAAPSCGDVFSHLTASATDPNLAQFLRQKEAFGQQLKKMGLWQNREDLVAKFSNLAPGERWIIRGVAPHEAQRALTQDASGRRRLRAVYGIKDDSVRPGFLLDQTLTPEQLRLVIFDLDRYASQGATLEAFAFKYNEGVPLPSVTVKYNRIHKDWKLSNEVLEANQGYWLVFRVPEAYQLDYHPQSKVRLPERVVHVPNDFELIAVTAK